MEKATDIIESLFERAEEYGKTSFKLTKLIALEAVTNILTVLVTRLSIILVISLVIFVLSIGASLALGEWLGKTYYGFFIVAGFYLLVGLLLHSFLQRWIKKLVTDLIIKQVT